MDAQERTEYVIDPYVCVNGFFFGKTPSEIKRKCGIPYKAEIDNIMETLTELRDACSLVYENKRLAYVVLNKHTDPVVSGVSIYEDGAIDKLMKLDPDHSIGKSYMNFRTLGVCVGGFGKKRIPEGKLVIAYSRDKVSSFDFYATED